MVCLSCAHDSLTTGPNCEQCGGWIGHVADGRGFVPQLERLLSELNTGEVDPATARERLDRLHNALCILIGHLDDTGATVTTLDLDEVQQGTIGGFLMPLRSALQQQCELVAGLPAEGGWSTDLLDRLNELQVEVMKGNEALDFLTESVLGVAQEAGVDVEGSLQELAAQQTQETQQ